VRCSTLFSLLLDFGVASTRAQIPPPGSDVHLAALSVQGNRVQVGTPANITNQPGYDNQPSFTTDGRAILFTSVRGDGQPDIYRYDLATKATTRVTTTAEGEYSATIMPGRDRFSVIRVETDMTQRLWSFRLDGTDPQVVFERVKPVGYHTWINADAAVLFVLGVGREANALVWADRSGRADTLSRDIGRSLTAVGTGGVFSYVQRMPDSTWQLRVGGPRRPTGPGDFTAIATMPRGADFVAWVSPDLVLTASGSKILSWVRGASAWSEVADLGTAGITRLSRLAVSPDGKWLALVTERP
jgi:hypothetical protein